LNARRRHGKRSYSDYTFGVWHDGLLTPISKAYFGFTDVELRRLDRWARNHTVRRFGPVREVLTKSCSKSPAIACGVRRATNRAWRCVFCHPPHSLDKPAVEADPLVAVAQHLPPACRLGYHPRGRRSGQRSSS
jgi:DNA ligase 1